ncbi:hypothetical protein A2291_04035 [candidate division WOR-1 bacterium RIFOXYB2_FULL_42_35]|uniref:Uncharacterized protein n=1 Tax=candidate division WOR-1 bacterium RIFOXYC2_FULL_41_25 TaxID=1802586 RepID=A0A1F4TMQ2_UNCSA|nr:MAG: hypothetical protein A2247_00875 [candidate division WOR-1 bacterium RIFOXYA2_FULL_41_14]OGC24300.1 MAG: hypothetical protein A2291_04035 [candidate division WOR-1 bacterium RIFOXYB2_FULL_42_35]OGC34002.1 MAG: hypothetical protein A2462_01440 [candidate division WOR-1 bacterium RIFOXYC2_FULL_41_25]OGC43129.1 MAG: hypothetical protein A2548_04400 [candidate division WOR-1 bacterium RIFOXYD2_FULL_41_8]
MLTAATQPPKVPKNYIKVYGGPEKVPKLVLDRLGTKTNDDLAKQHLRALDSLATIEAFHWYRGISNHPHEYVPAFTLYKVFLTPTEIINIAAILPTKLRENLTTSHVGMQYAPFTSVQKVVDFIAFVNKTFDFPVDQQFRLPTDRELDLHHHNVALAENAGEYYGFQSATGRSLTFYELSRTGEEYYGHQVTQEPQGHLILGVSKIAAEAESAFLFSLVRAAQLAA